MKHATNFVMSISMACILSVIALYPGAARAQRSSSFQPQDWNDFYRNSALIVDGEVSSVFPLFIRTTGPEGDRLPNRGSVDAIVKVNGTLKGPDLKEIVVTQLNGSILGRSGLQPGERYFLFLVPDPTAGKPATLPDRNHLPRYGFIDATKGTGKFKVADGKVQFLGRSEKIDQVFAEIKKLQAKELEKTKKQQAKELEKAKKK